MLIRHSALYATAKLLPGLAGMATTALLTRLMDPAAYGLYGLALVVMTFGSSMAFDWLGLAYLRIGAERGGAGSTVLALFGGVCGLTALAGLAAWFGGMVNGPASGAIGAGLVLTWCYAGFELAARFHVAKGAPGRYLVINVSRAGLSAVGAGTAAWMTGDPAWTALGTAAGIAGGLTLGGLSWRGIRVDRPLARELLAFGLPLAASLALAGLATSGTRALVEVMGSAEALGLYTAAFLLVQNTLAVVAASVASAGYSLAVRAVDRGDGAAAARQMHANGTLLLAVLAPMAVGMAMTAPEIAKALVGPRYVADVAGLTPWLAAAGFFGGIRSHFLEHAFQLGKRPGLQFGVTAGAAVVAVGLTVALVPRWGALGAAVAVALSMAASCIHAGIAGRRAWPLPWPVGAALCVAVGCGGMALVVRAAPGGLAGEIVAGVVSYGAVAVATGLLGPRPAAAFAAFLSLLAQSLALAVTGRRGTRRIAVLPERVQGVPRR